MYLTLTFNPNTLILPCSYALWPLIKCC